MSSAALATLLSPQQAGALMAPFRTRASNPDGFDSKMRLWIKSTQEWLVVNKRLYFCILDIQQSLVSDNGIRPAKECLRLVLSEMKRRSLIVDLNEIMTLKNSRRAPSPSFLSDMINWDDTTWLGWSLSNLVIKPTGWVIQAVASGRSGGDNDEEGKKQNYSDKIDSSIIDTMQFVCLKSLDSLSRNLHDELLHISKAEENNIFELSRLIELLEPILPSMITYTDRRELKSSLEVILDHLESQELIATTEDQCIHLVKIIQTDLLNISIDRHRSSDRSHNSLGEESKTEITKKDLAMYRLKKSKELLNNDIERLNSDIKRLKDEAISSHKCNDLSRAKGLMRNIKQLTETMDEKHLQLVNVETLLQQLISTESNILILQAYKDGAEALKNANKHTTNELQQLKPMDITPRKQAVSPVQQSSSSQILELPSPPTENPGATIEDQKISIVESDISTENPETLSKEREPYRKSEKRSETKKEKIKCYAE